MKCAGYEVDPDGVVINHPDFLKRFSMFRIINKSEERRSLTLHYYNGEQRAILDKAVLVIVRRKMSPLKAFCGDTYMEDAATMARIEKQRLMFSGE